MPYLKHIFANMKGFFGLSTPKHLLEKLRHDLALMEKDPNSTYLAFNFFVTAEHLPDWLHPGRAGEPSRRKLRNSEPLLETVSHIATGAKHFVPEAKHHRSIQGTGPGSGDSAHAYFSRHYFGNAYMGGGGLLIRLDGDAAIAFGNTITAIELARRVLAYWDACIP